MGKSDDRSDRGSKSSSSGEMDLSKDPKLHKRICTYLTENKDKVLMQYLLVLVYNPVKTDVSRITLSQLR